MISSALEIIPYGFGCAMFFWEIGIVVIIGRVDLFGLKGSLYSTSVCADGVSRGIVNGHPNDEKGWPIAWSVAIADIFARTVNVLECLMGR